MGEPIYFSEKDSMWKSELGRFRIVAFLEGVSLLMLFFVAMPMKYLMDIPIVVTWVGWAHGVLFMAYLLFGLHAAVEEEWGIKEIALAFFASFVPFGTFVFDRWIMKRKEAELALK